MNLLGDSTVPGSYPQERVGISLYLREMEVSDLEIFWFLKYGSLPRHGELFNDKKVMEFMLQRKLHEKGLWRRQVLCRR